MTTRRDKGASQIILAVPEQVYDPNISASIPRSLLSIGIEVTKPPVRRSRTSQKAPKDITAQQTYKMQLDSDKDVQVVTSRKAYERKINEVTPGLIIGDQRNIKQLKEQRLIDAKSYMSQLDMDLSVKIKMTTTESLQRPEQTSLVMTSEAVPETRTAGTVFSQTAQSSMYTYMNSPVKLVPDKPRFKKEVEGEITFFIGSDDALVKKKNKEMREQYLKKLNADNVLGSAPTQHARAAQFDVYANRFGWTGFDIGGCASNKANAGEDLHSKRSSQAEYARLLSAQLSDEQERRRLEKVWSMEAPPAQGKVPYMSSYNEEQ